jgi:glyoxylase-like metal-dependent hydrolase (beta-lactamase superfamily II)
MKIGSLNVSEVIFGLFLLDGGCMFGSVPKNLWTRSIGSDEENRIPLLCRSLLIKHGDRRLLVDVGLGDKWSEKQKQIYGIRNTPPFNWGFKPEEVTDVVLTHLHFDHAGGISYRRDDGSLALAFPQAKIHLQVANWNRACEPSPKDRASYLTENVEPLRGADLTLCDGDVEIYPGIIVHRVDGHTPGQQWIELSGGDAPLFFATDLIPTSHHVPLAYHMGYDVCADTLLAEKDAFLTRAVDERAIVCFQHDREVQAARIVRNDRGQYEVSEKLTLWP